MQHRSYDRSQPRLYFSHKIKGLTAFFRGDQGCIMHYNHKFCDVDLKNGSMDFEGKGETNVLPVEVHPEEKMQIAFEIGEDYAFRELAGEYQEEYVMDAVKNALPENISDKVEIFPERVRTDNGYSDMFVMSMLDTGTEVTLTYKVNGRSVIPKLDIRGLDDLEKYTARDIESRSKAEEEEYSKAIDCLSFLPVSLVGKNIHDWTIDVWNRSVEMIQKFQVSNYRAPIEVDVMFEGRKETIEIQAHPYDTTEGASGPADVKGYSVTGKLEEYFPSGGANIYEYAESIVNIDQLAEKREQDKKNLKNFFLERLYPYAPKLYYAHERDSLPENVARDFDDFIKQHAHLYHFMPLTPGKNQSLRQILEDKGMLDKQYDKMNKLRSSCYDYLDSLNHHFRSPEEYKEYQESETYKDLLKELRMRYNLLPDDLKPDGYTPKLFDDLENAEREILYADSKLIKGLKPEFTSSDIRAQAYPYPVLPRTLARLAITDEGLQAAFTRSGLEKQIGKTFEQLREEKNLPEVWLYSYFHDDSSRIMVIYEENKKSIGGEVKLSRTEQNILNEKVVSRVGPLENFIAESQSVRWIDPCKTFEPVVSPDKTNVKATFELNDDDMDEILARSNGYGLLDIENIYEYKDSELPMTIDAIFTLKGDEVCTRVNLSYKEEDEDEDIAVPFRDIEKKMLKGLTEHELGMTIEQALKKTQGFTNDKKPKKNRPPERES